jgi:hypothetical protein
MLPILMPGTMAAGHTSWHALLRDAGHEPLVGHGGQVGGCCRESDRGARMRDTIGAGQLEQVRSLARRPHGGFRSARTTPVSPTRAVDTTTGAAAFGVTVHRLDVLHQLEQ